MNTDLLAIADRMFLPLSWEYQDVETRLSHGSPGEIMTPIRVSQELWNSTMMPQGVLSRWLRLDGEFVDAGDALASVEIEGCVHIITSPGEGWLTLDCCTPSAPMRQNWGFS
jgi:hypothetical protein